MKDYQRFEIEDFLEDTHFRRWVFEENPEVRTFWQQWMLVHPEKEQTLKQAREILEAIRGEQVPLSQQRVEEKVAQLLHLAQLHSSPPRKTTFFVRPLWQYSMKIAASLTLLIGLGWAVYYYAYTDKRLIFRGEQLTDRQSSFTEVINRSDKLRLVTLPDRSTIALQKNSSVRYPNQTNLAKREVYLKGEAFFKVTKDLSKPFLVYANGLVTKVLGTSFNVRAYDDDRQVVVAVRTGRVSVFADSELQLPNQKDNSHLTGMILTPNQQATFLRKEEQLVRSLVEKPVLVDTTINKHTFEFHRTPLAQVLMTMEKAYGVDIVFDEERMADCTLTASLGDEPLFKKLELICRGTESTFEAVDGQILITGKGCR